MKTLKIYKEDSEFVVERINQFGTSFKSKFITEKGLEESLNSYKWVIHEYEIEASSEVWAMVLTYLQRSVENG